MHARKITGPACALAFVGLLLILAACQPIVVDSRTGQVMAVSASVTITHAAQYDDRYSRWLDVQIKDCSSVITKPDNITTPLRPFVDISIDLGGDGPYIPFQNETPIYSDIGSQVLHTDENGNPDHLLIDIAEPGGQSPVIQAGCTSDGNGGTSAGSWRFEPCITNAYLGFQCPTITNGSWVPAN